mgnify:FL=1|tara:strand:+ start:889 stop:1266 length:378 start_codon:yes stop_codon:yes gene_type:complete
MSHFSTIKTKFKDEDFLLKALRVLKYPAYIDQRLVNPVNHVHEEVEVQIAVGNKIGFKWNGDEYELIAELDAWDLDVPVQRFIDKITQKYAEEIVLDTIGKLGYEVEDKKTTVDNKIELICAKWL